MNALLALLVLAAAPSGLQLDAALEGRLQVHDGTGALVVELHKRPGAPVELGLPPGRYSVRFEVQAASGVLDVALEEGQRRSLGAGDFPRAPQAPLLEQVASAVRSHLPLGSIGLATSWVEADVQYFQGALFSSRTGGALRGLQLSLGANQVGGEMRGVQLAGVFNRAGARAYGLQASAGANLAAELRGGQLGGAFNWAGAVTGGQAALVNAGGEVIGLQLGAVNVAGRMKGVQLGLVNVADELTGVPFGLVNVIKNGQLHLEGYGSDLQPFNLALKTGSRQAYTTLFAGGGRARQFLFGFGAGAHLDLVGPLWMDLEVAGSSVHTLDDPLPFTNVLGQLRLMLGLRLLPQLALFAGPTFNCLVALTPDSPTRTSIVPFQLDFRRGGAIGALGWPGFQAGVRL